MSENNNLQQDEVNVTQPTTRTEAPKKGFKNFKNWSKKKKIIFFAIIAIIVLAVIIPTATSGGGGNSTLGNTPASETTSIIELGSIGKIGDVEYSINNSYKAMEVPQISTTLGKYEAGNKYIIVYLDVKNTSNNTKKIYASDFKLKYNDATYETDFD